MIWGNLGRYRNVGASPGSGCWKFYRLENYGRLGKVAMLVRNDILEKIRNLRR